VTVWGHYPLPGPKIGARVRESGPDVRPSEFRNGRPENAKRRPDPGLPDSGFFGVGVTTEHTENTEVSVSSVLLISSSFSGREDFLENCSVGREYRKMGRRSLLLSAFCFLLSAFHSAVRAERCGMPSARQMVDAIATLTASA
jgi:hypothetical protein